MVVVLLLLLCLAREFDKLFRLIDKLISIPRSKYYLITGNFNWNSDTFSSSSSSSYFSFSPTPSPPLIYLANEGEAVRQLLFPFQCSGYGKLSFSLSLVICNKKHTC